MNLLTLNFPLSEALIYVFIFAGAAPRGLNFILEVGGGYLSQRLGPLGSFKLLPYGYFLRSISFILLGLSCFLPTIYTSLACAFIGVFIGQVGHSIISGIYEDAYGQTAKYLSKDDKGEKLVSSIEFTIKYIFHSTRVLASSIGALCVVIGFYFPVFSFLITLPFIVGAMITLYATSLSNSWYLSAKEVLTFKSAKVMNAAKKQIKMFFEKGDWLWGITSGLYSMILLWVINLAPVTFDTMLDHFALGLMDWQSLTAIVLMTLAIPSLSIAGQYFYDTYKQKNYGKSNRYQKLKNLDSTQGYAFLLGWCFLSLPIILIDLSTHIKLGLLGIMILLNAILLTWVNWMRIPLIEEAEKAQPNIFNENRSFYFSLIAGTLETTIFMVGALQFLIKWLFDFSSPGYMVLMTNILCTLCLILWVMQRKVFLRKNSLIEQE